MEMYHPFLFKPYFKEILNFCDSMKTTTIFLLSTNSIMIINETRNELTTRIKQHLFPSVANLCLKKKTTNWNHSTHYRVGRSNKESNKEECLLMMIAGFPGISNA